MARPQSEAKLGFFPFPAPCLPLLATHLESPDDPTVCFVLDPCAGKGVAINHLSGALGVPQTNVHAVELSESRANDLRRDYPDMRILGPASFLGTGISYSVFSFLYLNPPYSSEMGGGRREELTFLVRGVNHLSAGGVLAFVVPENVVFDWGQGATAMRHTLACRFSDLEVYNLPEEHRGYNEIVVLGRKRKHPIPDGDGLLAAHCRWWETAERLPTLGEPARTFKPPAGIWPRRFEQTAFTPEGLKKALRRSPLSRSLDPVRAATRRPPPLPPGKGHTALILVSGDLDGLVWPDGEPPHVIRGTSQKIKYRADAKCERREDGSSVEVFDEKSRTVVRAVSVDGKIHTFTDNTDPDPDTDTTP